MDGVTQITTGRERRRQWRMQDKLRIVGDLGEPGARACDVAVQTGRSLRTGRLPSHSRQQKSFINKGSLRSCNLAGHWAC